VGDSPVVTGQDAALPDSSTTPDSSTVDGASNDSASNMDAADAAPFSVASLSTLVLWLDSSKIAADAAINVSTWADQSSKGNNAVQSDGSAQPTFDGAGVGGKPGLYFTDQGYNPPTTPPEFMLVADKNSLQWATDDFLLEVVAAYNADPHASDALYGKGAMSLLINSPPDGAGKITFFADATHSVTTTKGGYNSTGAVVIGVHRKGGAVEIRINGVSSAGPVSASVDVSAASQAAYLGALPTGISGNPYKDTLYGDIGEIIALDASGSLTISDGDVTGVETYLKNKYGIP
jgi:hypothetical protein